MLQAPYRQDVATPGLAWQTGGLAILRLYRPLQGARAMYTRTGFFAAVSALAIANATAPASAQTPAEYAQTAAYAAAHQNKDGGFAAKAGREVEPGRDQLGA